jgi:hypothetical protein
MFFSSSQSIKQQTSFIADKTAITHQIGSLIYKTIVMLQEQAPESLVEKYRALPWNSKQIESLFEEKLCAALGTEFDRETSLVRVKQFLQILLTDSFFQSPGYKQLTENIQSLLSSSLTEQANQTLQVACDAPESIAILLLDAENIQLTISEEQFLTGICKHSLRIKIAFANWRSSRISKQDADFHRRGYQLIHVPAGKNSADMQMTAIGSSIFIHYPTAKEVFVCSSDYDLTHLCNKLQADGMNVYSVSKKSDLAVLDLATGKTTLHLAESTKQLSLDQCIVHLREIIAEEQRSTSSQWVKLSRISTLFKSKYNLTISQAMNALVPAKRARDLFIENPSIFVTHQLANNHEIYISLFESGAVLSTNNQVSTIANSLSAQTLIPTTVSIPTTVNSREELEQVLIYLLRQSTSNSALFISIEELHNQLRNHCGQPIKHILQSLNLNLKYISFLKSCNSFRLKQTKNKWEISLKSMN